jgi:hypothetical protein
MLATPTGSPANQSPARMLPSPNATARQSSTRTAVGDSGLSRLADHANRRQAAPNSRDSSRRTRRNWKSSASRPMRSAIETAAMTARGRRNKLNFDIYPQPLGKRGLTIGMTGPRTQYSGNDARLACAAPVHAIVELSATLRSGPSTIYSIITDLKV